MIYFLSTLYMYINNVCVICSKQTFRMFWHFKVKPLKLFSDNHHRQNVLMILNWRSPTAYFFIYTVYLLYKFDFSRMYNFEWIE